MVTRLECPETGVRVEGWFGLGWIGRLTPDQLDFVGVVISQRGNLQKVASYLGVAYNTVRSRMDEVVEALGGLPGDGDVPGVDMAGERESILAALAAGDISVDSAEEALAGLRGATS